MHSRHFGSLKLPTWTTPVVKVFDYVIYNIISLTVGFYGSVSNPIIPYHHKAWQSTLAWCAKSWFILSEQVVKLWSARVRHVCKVRLLFLSRQLSGVATRIYQGHALPLHLAETQKAFRIEAGNQTQSHNARRQTTQISNEINKIHTKQVIRRLENA